MKNPRKKIAFIVAAILTFFPLASSSSPLTVHPFPGITIHTPDEILETMTTEENGTVFFQRDSRRWELVTDVADERISNKGDGRFYPMEVSHVINAVKKIRFPLEGVKVEMFILPYPRVEVQSSSTTNGAVFLSPGVREYSRERIEFVVAHEMGHVVQRQYMPESRKDLWAKYKALRQIADENEYNENAPHENRPREVFAEDFRIFFSEATSDGELSLNVSLESPQNVLGLKHFFLSLVRKDEEELSLKLNPNPVRDGTTFVFEARSSQDVSVRVFDARGNLVRTLIENGKGTRTGRVFWDGNDSNGRALPAGIYFARLSTPNSHKVERVLLLR